MTFDFISPPLLLGAACLILLMGEWVFRRAVEILLFALGAVAGRLVCEQLVAADLIPLTVWSAFIVSSLCGLLTAALARNDVILRNLLIIGVVALCFVTVGPVSQAANIPGAVVWIVFLLGAAVSPPLLVASLVTALVVYSLQPLPIQTVILIFAGAVAYSRIRHSSWYWRSLDHCLQAKLSSSASLSASKASAIPVLLRFRQHRTTEKMAEKLRGKGIKVESLPGGFLAAEVPASMLKKWNHPLVGLVHSQPLSVLNAEAPINLVPIKKTDAEGMDLETIAKCIRTDKGKAISPDEASGRGTVVAIIDTGVRPINEALKRALVHSEDFTNEGSIDDLCGHGTMVAQNVLAIAPEAKIIRLKVLDENGSGSLLALMRAFKYVADQGDKITLINLSLGASLCHGEGADPLCRALASIQTAAIAAIGNSGPDSGTIECPGCSKDAIGVGAIDRDGQVAKFSSRGPCRDRSIKKPDLVNYGVAVKVQDHTGAWVNVSGHVICIAPDHWYSGMLCQFEPTVGAEPSGPLQHTSSFLKQDGSYSQE